MSPTIADRICARLVQYLGTYVTALNYLPFGINIVARYRAYSVRASYSNKQKMDSSHISEKLPKRNVEFCQFIGDLVGAQVQSILEIGAGRSVNANLLAPLLASKQNQRPQFFLLDRYVNPANYLDDGISAKCVVADIANFDFAPSTRFDLGFTRATLSLLPPRIAKRALMLMARSCNAIVINECATDASIRRTVIRSDRHMIHPYQFWLAEAGWNSAFHDWAINDPTYNGIISASCAAMS
jgi:hypothetical protein